MAIEVPMAFIIPAGSLANLPGWENFVKGEPIVCKDGTVLEAYEWREESGTMIPVYRVRP